MHARVQPQPSYSTFVLLLRESPDNVANSSPADLPRYNEFHALIVRSGKDYGRASNPRCDECPPRRFPPEGMPAS